MKIMPGLGKMVAVLFLTGSVNFVSGQINYRIDTSKIHIHREEVFVPKSDDKVNSVHTSSTADKSLHWVAKLNPAVLARGEVPVYIEHRLSSSYSVEAGCGITFRDFFKETILEAKPLFQNTQNVDNLNGLTGKLALRYFPFHEACSGLYLSPEVDAKNYRKDVQGVYMGDDGRYTQGKLRDQQKYLDVKAVVGFQNTEDYGNDMYVEYYIGGGMRISQEDNVVPDERNGNVIILKHANLITPILSLGIKVGLGF